MQNDSKEEAVYRPNCLRLWAWTLRHGLLMAVPLVVGILLAPILPTGVKERILFSKQNRNAETRRIAGNFR